MSAPAVAVLLAGLTLLAGSVLSNSARAESGSPRQPDGVQSQPIGKIESAKGSFTITHGESVVLQANVGPDGGLGQGKVGDPVYQRDIIQTGADGTVGLALNDGTAFNVSANARIVLDEFVYDPNSTSNSALISLTKGTFTFIAGKVAKTGDMKVDTPVATMGIRGTAPRVSIAEDGSVRFSTLVEDYLRNAPDKGGAPAQPGKGVAPTQPGKGAAPAQQERRAGPATPASPTATPDQRQREARNAAAAAAVERAIKDQNKALERKLSICRGC